MKSPMNVLHLEDVTKVYPGTPPVAALDGVTFAVGAGDLLGVVGPSGSGKSTLLHIMGTLDRATGGRSRWSAMTWPICPTESYPLSGRGTSASSSSSFISSRATPRSTTSPMAFSTRDCHSGSAGPRRWTPWNEWVCPIGSATWRRCSPVARDSVSPLPGRWSGSLRSSSQTSRPAISTPDRRLDRAVARRAQHSRHHGGRHHPRSRDRISAPAHHRDARRAHRERLDTGGGGA